MKNQIIPTQGNLFSVSEIQLCYKKPKNLKAHPPIISSKTSFDLLATIWQEKKSFKEGFQLLLLNRANRVLGIISITETAKTIEPKVLIKRILTAALKASASAIILASTCHQVCPHPTEKQRQIAKLCSQSAKVLDLSVLDYLIYTTTDYYSFADEGKLMD